NTVFLTPDVPLAQITTAVNNLEITYNQSQDGGKQQTAAMYAAEKILDDLLRRQALYVERITFGNEAQALSSGFHTSKQHSPMLLPEFTVKNGNKEGEIIAKHKAVKGAKAWAWQYCLDPITVTGWTFASMSTQAFFTIKGLNPGVKYWFRVAYVTSKGMSEWCDPYMKIVQ
ncbi:MAG: fibronectin type III domain-containing protein, partial [Bacteroidota bacterium]